MTQAAFRVASGPCRLQRLLRWWLALCLLAVLPVQGAQAVLQLSGDTPDIDAWPALTVWTDAEGQADLDTALAQRQHFASPDTPHANLGVRRDAVWLRLQLQVDAQDDGRWVLDADYPSLDRVEVHVLRNGQLERQAVLGDQLAFDERVLASRSHAMRLPLQPGASYELLLRVQTTSSMIVPLRLMKAEAFHARETRLQMLQGLATGIALCLLVYALAHWVGSREPMFLYYAVMMAGVGLFFFAYYGLAAQYLWPGNRWLTNNMAPLAVLVGLGGGMPLIERLLDLRALQPRMARLLQALAVVAFGAATLFALELISYRTAHLMGTLLGPMPIVLAVHGAWRRWRQGDMGARYIFAGWAVYLVGVAVMASLLRGWIDSNGFTQHAFQTASLFEALMWLRVLGVRNADARREAERVDRERELLQTLAHTDALTGLPNRRGLEAELSAALPAPDAQRVLAVYLLDLDGFKAVNDRLGHDAGDELLVAVAKRLRSELRHRDVVARLGGDEFVVLARDLGGEADAWQLGRKLVGAFAQPFLVRGQHCSVGLTAGFALAPLDGHDAPSLLRRADAAMYAGKQSGKGTVRRGAASVGLAGI